LFSLYTTPPLQLTHKWSAAAHSTELSSLSRAEQGMSNNSSDTTDIMASLQQEITRLFAQLHDLIHSKLVHAAITPSQRAVSNRYRDIYQDLRSDYDKNVTVLQRAKERHELLATASPENKDGGSDSGMDSLLRERNHIQNSMSAASSVLGQAESVRQDLRWQGRSLRSTGTVIGQMLTTIPGVNHLVEQIRRRRSRDDKILAGVISSCILFTLWYLFG
jgi:Golgi SNAP receptor complex protein 1